MTVEYVEKVYNTYSKFYDFIFGAVFSGGRERAPELLDLKAGDKLLEVGVGTGLTLPLLPRNIEFTGIDLSQKMLDQAHKRVEAKQYQHVKLIKMDATKLEFEDNAFDRVLAAYIVSVVPDANHVVEEMKRVCKPGGYLVFLNHFLSDNPVVGFFEKLLSPLFYRVGFKTNLDLHKMLEKSGLEIESIESVDFLGNWKAVRCVNSKGKFTNSDG